MKVYYVYIDRTLDGRPFYVGKGIDARVRSVKRNRVHARITKKYGQMRTIVFETMCEAWAFEREIELIALLKTHCGLSGHWGANLTNGGEGASGAIRSDETRKRMSDAHRGHHRSHVTSEVTRQRLRQVMCGDGNPMFGRTLSAESREKIRVALQGEENPNFGKPLADEVRRKIADALRGKKRRPFTDEHRRKLSLARKRRANFVEVTSPS